LHASRVAADVIDFCTAEFGYLQLADEIAMGSSMMPQKRNPDLFELIRGKCGRAVGNLNALLVTVKGLPGGYNRDLQEDRQALPIDPRFTPEVLRAADAAASVARKKNAGGTGRASLDAQIASLRASAKAAASASSAVPRLDRLLAELKEAAL